MSRSKRNFLSRNKYKLNGLVLILPFIFLYQSLNPVFPSVWQKQIIGSFEIAPMPYNLKQPYLHGGHYTKDFFLIFSKGKVADIRQAYLNIGEQALPLVELQKHDEGILHGSQHGQEVHGIAPETLKPEHKVWLTIEDWQGDVWVTSWDLPKELLAD
ncbi:hypothetical protein GCM10008107_14430 [Psychrosphaera saromensis]|uniref:Uncharacterized protein n=1 Tax=Psychrosphaera saromensis TaxID=716813 RepID=A0A2S7UUC6_9GAMM|nr:hypothetical protein [Psychrosphaera saromensis]PQJ53328.1 hypothetical protein BTO11_06365 [Psychrosphaera saromensis]GHB66356.1 hypothetical protein GCM10008107_14430 [Psychrosphaera saromensis]GLQ14899.1 hypothetical protein GCM10007917_23540 [Psychrosphaera saromensis]